VLQQLVKEGVLFASEYERMAIPTYYRTAEEWKQPFTFDSDVAQRLPLSLDYFDEIRLPDVYLEQFEKSGDAEAFAEAYTEAYTGFFKAAYDPCLFVSLSDSRTPQDRQHVI
jgi:hypothetical protein